MRRAITRRRLASNTGARAAFPRGYCLFTSSTQAPAAAAATAPADPRPRYSGITTFLRCPHVDLLGRGDPKAAAAAAAEVDIGIVGVPYDGGVTNRPGARFGPREVRAQSVGNVRRVNQATGVAPLDGELRVADVGDAFVSKPYELESAHAEIEAHFQTLAEAGVRALAVGGDHSISLPILRALSHRSDIGGEPVGMVHIDAHCDTGDNYGGSRFHHGAPFKVAVDEGILDPARTIQIGIRGTLNHQDMWSFSHTSGMRVMYVDECQDVAHVLREIRAVVGNTGRPTYISFDIDSLDPAFAPGTGTPEIGGLTSLQAQQILRGLCDPDLNLNVVGADCVEVSPPDDVGIGITALAGANITFELLCVLHESMMRQRRLG